MKICTKDDRITHEAVAFLVSCHRVKVIQLRMRKAISTEITCCGAEVFLVTLLAGRLHSDPEAPPLIEEDPAVLQVRIKAGLCAAADILLHQAHDLSPGL